MLPTPKANSSGTSTSPAAARRFEVQPVVRFAGSLCFIVLNLSFFRKLLGGHALHTGHIKSQLIEAHIIERTRGGFALSIHLREMLNYISDYSLYAYSEEVKEGYLTIEGGHRIGMAGQVVKKDGKVTGLSHITF